MAKITSLKNVFDTNGFGDNFSRSLDTQNLNVSPGLLEDAKVDINVNTDTIIEDTTITIQGDIADVSTDISNSTITINNNTDTKVATSTSTTASNINTTEGNINVNTNTKVDELKPTPNAAKNSITYGNTYQTILNISGEGLLQQAFFTFTFTHPGNFTDIWGYKITVDGTIIYEQTGTQSGASTPWQYFYSMSMGNTEDNNYSIYNLNSSAVGILNYYFKTSLKIEAYCNSDNFTTRSNRYKNIYSLLM